jgi:hypothetical protein
MSRTTSVSRFSIAGVAALAAALPAAAAPLINAQQSTSPFKAIGTELLQTNLKPGGVAAVGTFAREGEQGEPALRDTLFGALGGQNAQGGASLAAATAGTGDMLTYTLDTDFSPAGYRVIELNTLAGWDGARYGQRYDLSFHLVGTPAGTFTPAIVVDYQPPPLAGNNNTFVNISDPTGTIATGVDQVRFTFFDAPSVPAGGYQGYRELDVIGTGLPVPEPAFVGLAALAGGACLSRRRRRA